MSSCYKRAAPCCYEDSLEIGEALGPLSHGRCGEVRWRMRSPDPRWARGHMFSGVFRWCSFGRLSALDVVSEDSLDCPVVTLDGARLHEFCKRSEAAAVTGSIVKCNSIIGSGNIGSNCEQWEQRYAMGSSNLQWSISGSTNQQQETPRSSRSSSSSSSSSSSGSKVIATST